MALKKEGFQLFTQNDIPTGPEVSYTSSGMSFRKDVVPPGMQYVDFYSDTDRGLVAIRFKMLREGSGYKLLKTEGKRLYLGANLWQKLMGDMQYSYGQYKLETHIDLKILRITA